MSARTAKTKRGWSHGSAERDEQERLIGQFSRQQGEQERFMTQFLTQQKEDIKLLLEEHGRQLMEELSEKLQLTGQSSNPLGGMYRRPEGRGEDIIGVVGKYQQTKSGSQAGESWKETSTLSTRAVGPEISQATADSSASKLMDNSKRNVIRDSIMQGQSKPLLASNSMQRSLLALTSSRWFHMLVGVAVVLYAVFLGIDVDMKMAASNHATPVPWADSVEFLFLLFFFVELLLRVLAEQWQFFHGPNMRWNLLESLILISCIVEMYTSRGTMARLLRIFRVGRVVRVVQVFKLFHEFRFMFFSFLSCLASMGWALLLLFVVIYAFVLYLEEVALLHLRREPHGKVATQLREDWDGVVPAMFSLIYSVSGGEDWHSLVEPFMTISLVHGFAYTLFVLCTVLGMFNILVGIFVQQTRRVVDWDRHLVVKEQREKVEERVRSLTEVFYGVDEDKSGHVSFEELACALEDPEVTAYFAYLGIEIDSADVLFGLLGLSMDASISKDEFVSGCLQLKGGASPTEVAIMMQNHRQILQRLSCLQRELTPHQRA